MGNKTKKILKKKKIEKVFDLLWQFPQGYTDRTNLQKLDKLIVGKINTIQVKVKKYNFPRIRNLPNKVICEDLKGKINIIFFNTREGYIRKSLPLDSNVIISGKVNFFKNNYQITNPAYIVPLEKKDYVNTIVSKYALTEGITEKIYRKLIDQVFKNIDNLDEWHNKDLLKKIGNTSWYNSIYQIHNNKNNDLNANFYKRLAYDEILANFLVLSQIRKRVKKEKKVSKNFNDLLATKIIKNFKFELTNDQKKAIKEINADLESELKMFRLLQGDVGSGKTIVSLVVAANVINSKWQVALMAPTEILAKQHYELARKIFVNTDVQIEFLTGKTEYKIKNKIYEKIKCGETNLLIGTHSLFQKNVVFKKLGLIIIDEQHKFGVKQRIELSKKGGVNCDILLMSATPIPRTLVLSFYGDMDVSKITEKPLNRKNIITLSKPEEKMNEIIIFINKKIKLGIQVFWVCPLIEESKK